MFLLSGQKGRDAMYTDSVIGSDHSVRTYRHPLLQKLNPYLRSLHGLSDPTTRRCVRWTPLAASLAAILMALDIGCSLTVRFRDTLACLGIDFQPSDRLGKSYNGLLKALVRQAPAVLPGLKSDLRYQAREALAHVPQLQGWTLLAVDGSKEDLPRTRSLEKHFGIADNGKCPQALITTVVEVYTGLLWDWRIVPGRGSETAMLAEMADQLPDSALLLADGNFVGYPIWSALAEARKHFLIRVGGDVSLIRKLFPHARIERLDDIVYAWPVHHQTQSPPLRLRLIKVRGGKDPLYLLTNVLDRRRLTKKSAGKAYRKRWGVELFYRTLKRTFGCAKLRSRSGARAAVELEWAMITMCIVTMMAIQQLHRQNLDCSRLSPAALLRALRRSLLWGGSSRSPQYAIHELNQDIGQALRDEYVRRRPKRSRHRPVTRNTPFPRRHKPPRVRIATPTERQRAIEIYGLSAA
jgi:hypothetical protein